MTKYDTYNNLIEPVEKFEDLRGRILSKVVQIDDDELRFHLTDDHYVKMYHSQDCCESVSIEDIVGDLDDLVGTPLLIAEEVNSDQIETPQIDQDRGYYVESETWTYYRFSTIKGSVSIRWYGTSNGYYSESVDIEIVG